MNKQYVSERKGQVILSLHVFDRKSFLQGLGCAKATFVVMGFVQGFRRPFKFLGAVCNARDTNASYIGVTTCTSTRVCDHLTADKAYISVNVFGTRILTPGRERKVKTPEKT